MDTGALLDPASPLLALRLAGQDHALEPGREYLLGSDAACDFRVAAGTAARQVRLVVVAHGVEAIHLGGELGTFHNGERFERAALGAGDVLRFGDGAAEAIVVHDDGAAAIVPIPALRAAAVARAVRTAARALRRPVTFRETMAEELRRSPWLLLSLALHVVLLLAAFLLSPVQRVPEATNASVTVDVGGETANLPDGPPPPPEVVRESPDSPFDAGGAFEPVTPPDPRDAQGEPALHDAPSALRQNARVMVRAPQPDSSRERGAGGGVEAIGSGAFQRTVSELRRSGLEIVFVFDSTGSMTRTILDTKATIAQMLAVLQALVPDARVGLVTFRDHGPKEDYVVRQVPLGRDFWRLSNFMQSVTAAGGGDLPEAVRAGLTAAFGQHWRAGARRVVVLAGDAPPHDDDEKRLLSEVRTFTANGRSFVHSLITAQDPSRRDVNDAFAAIARAGKGLCERIETRDRVLQRVLTLAFGREFDRDIAAVVQAVEEHSRRVDVAALDLARRGGPDLARALCEPPVPQELWNALVRRPRRAVAEQLVDLLGAPGTPEQSRHAIAAALQRMLELPLPPIDPDGNERPQPRELDRLRRAAAGLRE